MLPDHGTRWMWTWRHCPTDRRPGRTGRFEPAKRRGRAKAYRAIFAVGCIHGGGYPAGGRECAPRHTAAGRIRRKRRG
jgi:hypothetical protein